MSQIFGVLGHPLTHSFSPIIFEAAFWEYNIDAEYKKFDIAEENLQSFLKDAKTGINGLSVTIPYKEKILPFLQAVDEKAKTIVAINTIVNKNGKLKGYNTDYFGAKKALEEFTDLENKRVLILGAGGAAAAIVYACAQAKAEVTILNRDLEKAKKLANLGENIKVGKIDEILKYPAEILIHTTSIGMSPNIDVSLVPPEYFKRGMIVFDIVYNPLETKLVKQARRAECRIIPGYKMLLYQAEKQFELWFNKKAPIRKMETALLEALTV